MANRFLKTLASAFVVENENNDTVDAQVMIQVTSSSRNGEGVSPSA